MSVRRNTSYGKIDLNGWGFSEDIGGKAIAKSITEILRNEFRETPPTIKFSTKYRKMPDGRKATKLMVQVGLPLDSYSEYVIYERSLLELAREYVDYDYDAYCPNECVDWEAIEENLRFEISQMKAATHVFERVLSTLPKKKLASQKKAQGNPE